MGAPAVGIGPVGMSEFDFGLKRYIPKTASPITIAAISTHLVVLLINIRLILKVQIYFFFKNDAKGSFPFASLFLLFLQDESVILDLDGESGFGQRNYRPSGNMNMPINRSPIPFGCLHSFLIVLRIYVSAK